MPNATRSTSTHLQDTKVEVSDVPVGASRYGGVRDSLGRTLQKAGVARVQRRERARVPVHLDSEVVPGVRRERGAEEDVQRVIEDLERVRVRDWEVASRVRERRACTLSVFRFT